MFTEGVSTDYVPASALGWVDTDAKASERVAALLRALQEPGTLDSLGLGTVRDGFADLLSPGTSTIQTRVRYFLFVPWLMRRAEAERVAPARYASRLRHHEVRLIECLRHLPPNSGVIGAAAGASLKRMPSEIYWNGLGVWGIRRTAESLGSFARRPHRSGVERDDDGSPTGSAFSAWADLPPAPDGFLDAELDFALSREEAEFLAERITRYVPGSLLGHLALQPETAEAAQSLWDLPTDGMPSALRATLRHARCVSDVTTGPQHLYNLLVARRARTDFGRETGAFEERVEAELDKWAAAMSERRDEVAGWRAKLDETWAMLAPVASVPVLTRAFITQCADWALDDPHRLVDDPAAHTVIAHRELALKGRRARLRPGPALEAWNGETRGGRLTYRWETTRSHLRDIAAGLAGG